jgi:hypothetical protein
MFSPASRRCISLDQSLLCRISWSEWVAIANSVAIIRARWAAEDAQTAANQEEANANKSHFSDDSASDLDSVAAVEYVPKYGPNWDIKLNYHANPNTDFLDFDNDPFLC